MIIHEIGRNVHCLLHDICAEFSFQVLVPILNYIVLTCIIPRNLSVELHYTLYILLGYDTI
jgi:hypothetical protein